MSEHHTLHNVESRLATWFSRMLQLAGDVRASELRDVGVMFVSIFLLLVAYYVLKTVREPLILATGGAELKSYAAGAQAALLLAYVPLYGAIAARLPVAKLVTRVNLAMAGFIQLFFVLGRIGSPMVGFGFYVFVGIFSLTLIAQFWSFANDIYTKGEGDRLFPLIAVGATLGAPIGAFAAGMLFSLGVSPWLMMQIASALLILHTITFRLVHKRPRGDARGQQKSGNGFALVLASPYLRLLALLLVFLNIVNTTGEFILGKLVTAYADQLAALSANFDKEAFIGAYYGRYFFWVNVASVLLQVFVVSRLAKRFGMGGVVMALPFVALGAYSLVMTGASIALVRWMKTAENASDYSVMNTAKQMLWLPTTREEKYAAKQAIDTFFVRMGDMISAGIVFLGTRRELSVAEFAGTNVTFVLVTIVVAWLLLREYGRLTGATGAFSHETGPARLAEAKA